MEKKKFKRVYHPYWEWEEVPHNMWGTVENKKEWLQRAIEFTCNHNLYGSYMMRVIQEWPISCENALTDSSLNRRAWVGHAAVALALQCPEDIVREAWKHLSYEQQLLANKEADGAIAAWEQSYIKDKGLQPAMGGSMLF
jgi:hypothetical protein